MDGWGLPLPSSDDILGPPQSCDPKTGGVWYDADMSIFPRAVAFLFAAAFLAFSVFPQESGETPPAAVLVRGPVAQEGIPYLPYNIIPCWTGLYESEDGEIRLYFTEEVPVLSSRWEPFPCRLDLRQKSDVKPLVLAYTHEAGWTVFAEFPRNFRGGCLFLEAFSRRFTYYRRIAAGKYLTFPALLDY